MRAPSNPTLASEGLLEICFNPDKLQLHGLNDCSEQPSLKVFTKNPTCKALARDSAMGSTRMRYFWAFCHRTASLLTLLAVATTLIATALLSTVEVSSRISAAEFINGKIGSIERYLAGASPSPEGASAEKILESSNLLLEYQKLYEELSYLSFSGANNNQLTIYNIRTKISDLQSGVEFAQAIADLNAKIGIVTSEIDEIQRALRVASAAANSPSEFSGELSENRLIDSLLSSEERGLSIKDQLSIAEELLYSKQADLESLLRERELLRRGTAGAELVDSQSIAIASATAVSEASAALNDPRTDESGHIVFSVATERTFFSPMVEYFTKLQTDVLLAAAVVSCGGIGAIGASLRSRKIRTVVPIASGLIAGFITFLIVKGGRYFFIVQGDDSVTLFINPFAVAFAGILAGLFTEKAFFVLSSWVDEVGERLVNRSGSSAETRTQKTAEDLTTSKNSL